MTSTVKVVLHSQHTTLCGAHATLLCPSRAQLRYYSCTRSSGYASLRSALDTMVASTAAVGLRPTHTTLCGAHDDANTVPLWRLASILQLHSQLWVCLTALSIRHCKHRQLQLCCILSTLLCVALTTTPTLYLSRARL